MPATRAKRSRAPRPTADDRWAELADLALVISREIQYRGYTSPQARRLTQSEGMVMRYLQGDPDAAPSQIAAATGLQRTNLSAVLKALEKKGLVERHSGRTDDARGVQVHLTDAGRANYTTVRGEWGHTVRAAADGDTTNLDAAVTLLTTIRNGLTRMRPSGPPPSP